MKRSVYCLSVIAIGIASLVWAQGPAGATLRLPTGDKAITIVNQGGQTYFAADEVLSAVGGSVTADGQGFRATLGGKEGAFAPDSRFAVVREDLIEMPVPPMTIEGRPYVPWQFFQGFLRSAAELEVVWDGASKILDIKPRPREALTAQLSVVQIEQISKVVVELSGRANYTLVREASAYIVRFKNPIIGPFVEQQYENPHISRAIFRGTDLILQLTAADVVGDAYHLESPFRVIVDLKKGTAPQPSTTTAPGQLRIPTSAADPPGIRTIVLDPGHGGKEVGAIGPNGLYEKDTTLAICQKLAKTLSSQLGTRVILTRETDDTVSLTQRTAIANQYRADLFVSVHVNASLAKGAHGPETYFLSLEASDELASRAAERENEPLNTPGTSAPQQTDLNLILWDLAHQEYLKESSELAEMIQDEMSVATGIENRGVKQAPFKVLVGATMPAALVEVGFISNPEEEAKLKDEAFQKSVVDALARAIGRYKTQYDTRMGLNAPAPAPAAPAGAPAAPATGTAATTATADAKTPGK